MDYLQLIIDIIDSAVGRLDEWLTCKYNTKRNFSQVNFKVDLKEAKAKI